MATLLSMYCKSVTGVGVVTVGGKEKKPTKAAVMGLYRFTHAQLEKEGIIVESNVPDNRYVAKFPYIKDCPAYHFGLDAQIYFLISCRQCPGHSLSHFIIKVGKRLSWKWILRLMICWRRLVYFSSYERMSHRCLRFESPFRIPDKTFSNKIHKFFIIAMKNLRQSL